MTRTTGLLIGLTLAVGIAWWAASGTAVDDESEAALAPQPAAASASRPVTRPVLALNTTTLPDKYLPLLSRNLFATAQGPVARDRSSRITPVLEDQFVLRGIMHQSGRYTALIEDLAKRQVRRANAGDLVARGRLSDVSFDGLRYQVEGHDTRVAIGEKLSGTLAVDPVVTKPEKPRPSEDAPSEGDQGRPRSKSSDKVAS